MTTEPGTLKPRENDKENLALVGQNSKVTTEQCFAECLWLEALIICKNCPHIIRDKLGNVEIMNTNVKGRFNILELAEKNTIQEFFNGK